MFTIRMSGLTGIKRLERLDRRLSTWGRRLRGRERRLYCLPRTGIQ